MLQKFQDLKQVRSALLGSIERFLGILIEHCAGAFPLWLAPEQVRILSITERSAAYAAAVHDRLKASGIRAAALDYGQGWYEGNAERMDRALHPELVKRIVVLDTVSKKAQVDGMGKTVLVNYTRRGFGTRTPEARRKADVVIYDITGDAAIAKLTMADWVDYLQLGKFDGRWQIVRRHATLCD